MLRIGIKEEENDKLPGEHLDFKRVFVDFMNVVTGGAMQIKGSHSSISRLHKRSYFSSLDKEDKDKWHHPWKAVGAEISFGNFLTDKEQLEYEVYCFGEREEAGKLFQRKRFAIKIPERDIDIFGFKNESDVLRAQVWVRIPEYIEVKEEERLPQAPPYGKQTRTVTIKNSHQITQVIDDNIKPAVQIKIELSKATQAQFNDASRLLITTRLELDKGMGHYFPYTIDGNERWLGALIKVAGNNYNYLYKQEQQFVIASLTNLERPEAWQ